MKGTAIQRLDPWWTVTITVAVALVVPKLVMDGMFMDGMLYTCVAKNMANGIGTFWFPVFSQIGIAGLRTFHEQPPLGFGIEALFFKALGNGMHVERLFSLLTCALTAWLIVLIWRQAAKHDRETAAMGWLPVFMWITMPVCFWSFQNVMLENTMGLFTTAAIWLSLRGTDSRHGAWYAVGAGLCIFGATLTKGLPGLFPLAVFFLLWAAKNGLTARRMAAYTVIAMAVPAALYAVLQLNGTAAASLKIYFFQRALARIRDLPTVSNRFTVLYHLLMELLPGIVIVAAVRAGSALAGKRTIERSSHGRAALFFLLAGIAGSLPLMLTLVQKRFYFVHALPLFAIGLALLIAPHLQVVLRHIASAGRARTTASAIAVVLLTSAVLMAVLSFGKAKRDSAKLHDVYMIGATVPQGSLIRADAGMWNDWSLQCYLVRYFNISIDPSQQGRDYYLRSQTGDDGSTGGYAKLDLPLKEFNLYRIVASP